MTDMIQHVPAEVLRQTTTTPPGELCEGCLRPVGFEYTRACANCERVYCEKCLRKDPHFNADAEYLGDPPRWVDRSRLDECVQCCTGEEIPHAA